MPAGRPKGALNKATREVREAARQYTPAALKTLADIMQHGSTDAARVAAARELLDRAHGKTHQAEGSGANLLERLTHDEQAALAKALEEMAGEKGAT